MNNRTQSPWPMRVARGVIASTLALGLSAGLLMMTYAAPGIQSMVITATAKPVSTAHPAKTTTPAAVVNPPVLGATYDNRAFGCAGSFCDMSTLTVYVPNAPDGTWIGVQWLDMNGPTWRDVEGWQGSLDVLNNNTQLPFKQWTVFRTNFGQGPFRYILKVSKNGPVLGLSPEFNLPGISGQNRLTFLTLPSPSLSLTAIPVQQGTATNGMNGVPVLNSNIVIGGIGCADTPCGQGNIQLFVPDMSNVSWAGVQWMDGFGAWHNVPGWQGQLEMNTTNNNTPSKQWSVYTGQLGQGPFRWVLYTAQNGSVVGVSPNFNLPQGGQTIIITLSSSSAAAQ